MNRVDAANAAFEPTRGGSIVSLPALRAAPGLRWRRTLARRCWCGCCWRLRRSDRCAAHSWPCRWRREGCSRSSALRLSMRSLFSLVECTEWLAVWLTSLRRWSAGCAASPFAERRGDVDGGARSAVWTGRGLRR